MRRMRPHATTMILLSPERRQLPCSARPPSVYLEDQQASGRQRSPAMASHSRVEAVPQEAIAGGVSGSPILVGRSGWSGGGLWAGQWAGEKSSLSTTEYYFILSSSVSSFLSSSSSSSYYYGRPEHITYLRRERGKERERGTEN